MKFPSECQLHLLCARKEQNHRFPVITLRGGWLYATDNRVMVAVKAQGVNLNALINIEPDAIKEARKRSKKGEMAELYVDFQSHQVRVSHGPQYVAPRKPPVPEPPDWRDIPVSPVSESGFNAKFLGELGRALGCDQLVLRFLQGMTLVRCVDDSGMIMDDRYGLVHPVEPNSCAEA